jgi:hypothetical protein
MKKLLVLMLVLGLCSTANAMLTAIQIDVGGSHVGASVSVVTGGTISLQIYSGNTDAGLGYLALQNNSLYSLANPVVTTNAGDQGGYVGPTVYTALPSDQTYELTVSRTFSGTITPGTMFTVNFVAGSATGIVGVDLYDEELTQYDTTNINIVPEPITITLLGLGGLFLRRRK